ncbi:MAG: HAMP domain-containing sensor histidine kinase [Verrucomicrobia bacterium]|nr:HAMP domain-containing sensor histidine kinase [Verrucomicrobiota bacterium]
MSPPREPPPSRPTGFRTKLLVAMMLVLSGVTVLGLVISERNLTAGVERALEREFQTELVALNQARALRHATLAERCRALVRRPRISSALEDNALDLLYPSAKDELRDIVQRPGEPAPGPAAPALRALFYRFLDRKGAIIPPGGEPTAGLLATADETRLTLPRLPDQPQLGYFLRSDTGDLVEIITTPIASTENGEVIAALVFGFRPLVDSGVNSGAGMKSAVWLAGWERSSPFGRTGSAALAGEVVRAVSSPVRVAIGGAPHLLFSKLLNPGSLYPSAYEVCAYPLADLVARQVALRWQILGAGGLVLLVGLAASHFASARLSAPVEKLAVDSEEHRTQRARAEAALEQTAEELQRSARFSADASHQLKTPVTVLRAGLEELLTRDNLTPDECQQISALVHQTYRLSSVIEDLLLLSRMDAGRLKLEFAPVDLSQLIEASLDDLGAVPDALELGVETDFPPGLHIAGEKRYTSLILQNLLENARKYNRPGGRVRVAARDEAGTVVLTIANTGRPIPAAAQAHIFERFHRGGIGENVPGYGLGLNLARELARLHGGDLRLARSDESWTEFEVRFRLATPAAA